MNKICTSLEQSQKLIELGVDIDTADMYWWYSGRRYYIEAMDDGDFNEEGDIPAWSLSALMELMPRSIKSEKNGQTYLSFHRGYEDNWMIEYSFDDIDRDYIEVKFEQRNPIDAAVEMVCWLKENEKL